MVSQAAGLDRAHGQCWVSLGRGNGAPLASVSGSAIVTSIDIAIACCVAGEYSLATSPAMAGLQALGCTPRHNSRRVVEARTMARPWWIWVAWAGEYSLATLPRLPSQHCGWVCKRCGCFGRRCQGCWGVLPGSIPGSRSSSSEPWPPQVLSGAADSVLRSVAGYFVCMRM